MGDDTYLCPRCGHAEGELHAGTCLVSQAGYPVRKPPPEPDRIMVCLTKREIEALVAAASMNAVEHKLLDCLSADWIKRHGTNIVHYHHAFMSLKQKEHDSESSKNLVTGLEKMMLARFPRRMDD